MSGGQFWFNFLQSGLKNANKFLTLAWRLPKTDTLTDTFSRAIITKKTLWNFIGSHNSLGHISTFLPLVQSWNQRLLWANPWIRNALHITSSCLIGTALPYKKVSKYSWIETSNLDMCSVDLVEETLEFLEALFYQLLTPSISLPNLFQHCAMQCTVCLNYKYYFFYFSRNPGGILEIYTTGGSDVFFWV